MGLLGPSWDWDEIQKKDAIMGEIRKENDRVLEKQRKENDRMIRAMNKNSDSTYDSSSTMSSIDYEAMNRYIAKEKKAAYLLWDALIISKKYGKYLYKARHHLIESLGGVLGMLLLLLLVHKIWWLFIPLLILSVLATIEEIKSITRPYIEAKRMRNTECYKKILEGIKAYGPEKIKKIHVNALAVTVYDIKDSQTAFSYKSYNFPDLPVDKHPMMIACLLVDLGINKSYNITTPELGGSFMAENRVMLKTIEKEEKEKAKKADEKKKQEIKDGKTW